MKPTTLAAPFAAGLLAAAGAVAQETPQLPESLDDFTHIHSLVIADEQSPLYGFHHFHPNATGWETFAAQSGFPYPEGTIFLAAVYEVRSDGAQHDEGGPRLWAIMRKDPAATETGGWRFAAFGPDGAYIAQDERAACFECHTAREDTDFVFSEPLGMALPRP